jgi:hypothetical protein
MTAAGDTSEIADSERLQAPSSEWLAARRSSLMRTRSVRACGRRAAAAGARACAAELGSMLAGCGKGCGHSGFG